jgi:RNA polymerase sigma factor (sigma-70 family)
MTLSLSAFAWRLLPIRASLIRFACRKRPCSIEDAEDLVGESVRLALLILPQYDETTGQEGLMRWLQGILRIVILRDRERTAQQVDIVPIEDAVDVPAPHPHSRRDRLQPAIDCLPPKLRAVVCYHLDGYSQADIARLLKIHRNTVANRMELAEQALRVHFGSFERALDFDLFDACARVSIYERPRDVWLPWRHNHPPGR